MRGVCKVYIFQFIHCEEDGDCVNMSHRRDHEAFVFLLISLFF